MMRDQDDRLGMRLKPDLRDGELLVLDQTPGLLASKHGLKSGDLIATVNRRVYVSPVDAVKELPASYGRIKVVLALRPPLGSGTPGSEPLFV